MRRITDGFTLVELTIAIAILGVLAAVAGPSFSSFIASSRLSYSKQLVETSLGKTFSATRSNPQALKIRGWKDSRWLEIIESDDVADKNTCVLSDDNCQKLDTGVIFEDDFEIEYLPPYGDIVPNEENQTDIVLLGRDQKVTIRVHHASGLVETLAAEKL